jgi:hypothetical protein
VQVPGAGRICKEVLLGEPASKLLTGDMRMNGFIAKTMATVCVAGAGMATGAGCYEYKDLVDPCYPERYEFAARQEVKEVLAAQVHNGHILDQTVWNYDFEPGTATLTPGGMDHLAYLARRRPAPDTTVYLQIAEDVPYEVGAGDKFVEARNNLDTKRMQAIQDYLAAQTSGRGLVFTVVRHDPSDPGMSAVELANSIRQMQTSSQGTFSKPAGGAAGAPAR